MAAGMSTRFVPLSMEVPKALLKVKGEILIERQIRQLREAGIQEIVIVVGYLKEKFEYLKEKYGVILIENPVYRVKNNHSTLYVAREYLRNTFVCSGDNYFTENVFQAECEHSYYASVFEAGDTDEWCLTVDEAGKIQRVDVGGKDAWVMKGHVYFDETFSKKMIPYLVETYMDDAKADMYWENIYMEHMDELEMYIRKYPEGIIEEFDSIEELRVFDERYIRHSGSKIMEEICAELNETEDEIKEICPVKKNGLVIGFVFQCREQKYQYSFESGLSK